MPKKPATTYGSGSISFEGGKLRVRIPIGKGKYKTVGRYPCNCSPAIQSRFKTRGVETCACGAFEQAKRVQNAALITRGDRVGGITFRELGDAYMLDFRGRKSERVTDNQWNSLVLRTVPFADWPAEQIDGVEIKKWAKSLRHVFKTRSIRKNGQRTTVELEETIGWQTQDHALGLVRRIFAYGIPEHLTANPCDGISIRKPDDIFDEGLSYLSGDDVEKLCSCVLCFQDAQRALLPIEDEYDLDMLVQCRHCPFEKRVAFVVAAHQCPREGELAGMNWERVDWTNKTWRIAQSWERTPKNSKARQQELLPRAEMFLRKWWDRAGRPTEGVMFPAGHSGPKAGPKRAFVREQPPELSNAEVVARADRAGISLTISQVADYRGKDRRRFGTARKASRYKRGYDWGWADHPEEDFYRLGWWRRLGMSRQVRFHDMRDTAATHLMSGTWGRRWPIEEVSKFLGHTSIKVTQERYASLTTEARLEAARLTNHGVRPSKAPAQNLPEGFLDSSPKSAKSLGAPGWTRTTDHQLRRHEFSERSQVLSEPQAGVRQRRADLGQLAREFLEALARGETCDPRPLASAVLAERPAMLAAEVLAGGPYTLKRARELAALINTATGETKPGWRRRT